MRIIIHVRELLGGADKLLRKKQAQSLVEQVKEYEERVHVTLDFKGVEYASRGFCRELVKGLGERKNISYANRNPITRFMMEYAFTNPPKVENGQIPVKQLREERIDDWLDEEESS